MINQIKNIHIKHIAEAFIVEDLLERCSFDSLITPSIHFLYSKTWVNTAGKSGSQILFLNLLQEVIPTKNGLFSLSKHTIGPPESP